MITLLEVCPFILAGVAFVVISFLVLPERKEREREAWQRIYHLNAQWAELMGRTPPYKSGDED